MRTDALKGIPNINQYISAFIIFINTLTMLMTPFLVGAVPPNLAVPFELPSSLSTPFSLLLPPCVVDPSCIWLYGAGD
jgi:hypothetical protein